MNKQITAKNRNYFPWRERLPHSLQPPHHSLSPPKFTLLRQRSRCFRLPTPKIHSPQNPKFKTLIQLIQWTPSHRDRRPAESAIYGRRRNGRAFAGDWCSRHCSRRTSLRKLWRRKATKVAIKRTAVNKRIPRRRREGEGPRRLLRM